MSQLHPFALLALLSGVFASTPSLTAAQPTQASRTPVLVELFTSEGCSSCPPADALLAKLDKLQPVSGAEIIILEEHVDYWEDGGWHDRFSGHQYTDRQTGYSSRFHLSNGIYTPQMVVDGSEQFVGNDGRQALHSITTAAQAPKAKLTLTGITVDGHRISASVSAPPFTFKGDLYAALVDPVATTDVKGGENGGHHLEHAGVVRALQRVGSLKDLSTAPHVFTLTAPSDAVPGKMRVIVFAQRSDQGPVVGAVSSPVTQ
jgi:hypothetical protein